MSRLIDIVKEDTEIMKEGITNEAMVNLKLAQISGTLAMIYDLLYDCKRRELSDDGR